MIKNNSASDLLPWQSEDQEKTNVHLYQLCVPLQHSVQYRRQKPTSLPSHQVPFYYKKQEYSRNRGFYAKKEYTNKTKGRSLQIKTRSNQNLHISDGLKKRAKLLSQIQFSFQSLSKQPNEVKSNQKNSLHFYNSQQLIKNKRNPKIIQQENSSLIGLSYFPDAINKNYSKKVSKQRTSFSGFLQMRKSKERQQKQKNHKKTEQVTQYHSKDKVQSARNPVGFVSSNGENRDIIQNVISSVKKTKQQSKCLRIVDSRKCKQKKKWKASMKLNINDKAESYLEKIELGGLIIVGVLRTQQ